MQLLTIENNELRLNTNLDEYTFGKTAHDAVLSQEGALFDGKNFRQWSFEEVKSYDAAKIGSATGSVERLVFYCAKNPLGKNAKTLAQYLDEGGEPALKAVLAVCTALTAAATDGYQLPMVGAVVLLTVVSLCTLWHINAANKSEYNVLRLTAVEDVVKTCLTAVGNAVLV